MKARKIITLVASILLIMTATSPVSGSSTQPAGWVLDDPAGKLPPAGGTGQSATSGALPMTPSIDLTPWTSNQVLPAIDYDSADDYYLGVWEDHYYTPSKIWGRIVEQTGPVGLTLDISAGATTSQMAPDIAYNTVNNEFLVVWESFFSITDHDIKAQRLSHTGANLSGIITVSSSSNFERNPVLAYDYHNNQYLVVWEKRMGDDEFSQYDIVAQRLGAAGDLVGSLITIDSGALSQINPTVAYSYEPLYYEVDAFLVLWQDNDAGNWDIRGRYVQASNGSLGTEFAVESGSQNQSEPDLIYNRGFYLYTAVWEEQNDVANDWDIKGAYIPPGTTSITSIPTPVSSTGSRRRMFPAITYDYSKAFYLVAFQYDYGLNDQDIWYSWINHRYQLVEPDMVITNSYNINETRPAVACDSNLTYLVAWEDDRNAGTNGIDIYLRFILNPGLYMPLVRR